MVESFVAAAVVEVVDVVAAAANYTTKQRLLLS